MLMIEGSVIKDGEENFYILDEIVGSGGYGKVFKAHRKSDREIFAVKTLSSTYDDKDSLLSFQKELQQAKLIDSPHIIKYFYIHDGSVHEEYPPYIIMEYAQGGTLSDLIRKNKEKKEMIDTDLLKQLLLQLASGMESISEVLVHRDIKPDNILVVNNVLKISDFGLSKMALADTQSLTFKGFGTGKYAAPEVWVGDKNTIQMDIYSMGMVFYELATLEYPYKINNYFDPMEYRKAHLYDHVNNPSSINPKLPQNISALIIRMLEKPIQRRFSTWKEIIESLQVVPIEKNDIRDLVEAALRTRNEAEIRAQQITTEKKEKEKRKDDFCNLVYTQYKKDVLQPIQEFIDIFNTNYPGVAKYELVPERVYSGATRFSNNITTPSNRIQIKMEVILLENFVKKVEVDRVFKDQGWREVNYIPQFDNKDILAWGQINDNNNKGFNLVLIKVDGSLYGDWFVLTNTNSGFGRTKRPEPFGFKLEELPEEILYLKATHIYNTDIKPFEPKCIMEYLSDRA